MATTTGSVEKLDIGKVIQVSFALVRRYLPTFAILALLFSALPVLLNAYLQSQVMVGTGGIGAQVRPGPNMSGAWLVTMVGGFVTLIGSLIFQAASIQISIADLNGRTVKVGDTLRLAMKHIAPLTVIGVLVSLAFSLGFVLLIVPGIMIACAFSVAAPARVVENIPAMATFRRSRDLTRGNRWRIFGLGVIYTILVGGFEAGLFALFGGVGGMMNPTSTPRLILLPIISLVIGTISASTIAVLYFELRRIKDGVGATDLAAVFD